MLFGAPILGIWYWCTDQFIVQRVLSARNISQARKGTIFAGFLKQLPLFIFVIPGIIAFALVSQGLLTFASDDADQALPAMITSFLPTGIRGLMLAGLLAALMSSLSSVFNSCSTLITMDFYQKWRPQSTGKELVRAGQIATGVLVFLSLGWIPFMKVLMGGGGIFNYLQSVQAYISPPIAAAFLFGLFFKRLNAKGAIWGLWTGFALGMLRLVLEYMTKEGIMLAEPGSVVHSFVSINFLHFAIVLFIISATVFFLVSLNSKPQTDQELKGVTFEKGAGEKAERSDVVLTVLLIAVVLAIWIIFSPIGMGS
jgi:SSS family solute:Na+ symporter